MMKKIIIALYVVMIGLVSYAETPLVYEGSVSGNVSSGDFAPYYIMSNNGGVLTQPDAVLMRLDATKEMDKRSRFSYGFGLSAIGGWQSEYKQYTAAPEGFMPKAQGENPSALVLQQAYGEVKYRGVFLTMGLKEYHSPLLNEKLGSGDWIQSNNARPVPQARAGFIDFQNIPFTNGWVQIQGEIAYGKYAHDDWFEDHYNYYGRFVNTDEWYNYKRLYLRTKPKNPFSVTVGMQMVTEFGGTATTYSNGKVVKVDAYDVGFKDLIKAFFPKDGGDNPGDASYYYGNTLGSWDFVARYRFSNKAELKAYVQKPFEDGSGIGWLNGFDGIWGLEYVAPKKSVVNGAVVEMILTTNQSGPLHWAPHDNPGTYYLVQATGGDDYYNNFRCNSYMNYGMSQGTPFVPSIIYNRKGDVNVIDNRLRGFHIGVSGNILKNLDYRMLVSYRKSYGTWSQPRLKTAENTSFMLEGTYSFTKVKGLSLKGQVAFDKGKLLGGDNFGVLLSVNYKGVLSIFDR